MDVFQLDSDGFLVGPTTADPDPLTPGEYLIPFGCVTIAPPEIPEGKVGWFVDEEWHVIDKPDLDDSEPPSLESEQAQKRAELQQWVFEKNATVEWEENTYQTDSVARERLLVELQMAELQIRPDPSPWRTLDNQMVILTNTQLKALCETVYLHHRAVTFASFGYKYQIEACTTIEDVQAIAFEMP
jgi:hypothetical protein